ncbi:MAG: hypothetical protein RL757_2960 [Bacteroidota bacterium]|jgi:hypothetical protein
MVVETVASFFFDSTKLKKFKIFFEKVITLPPFLKIFLI